MRQQLRARPSLERLEDRWCPALTGAVKNGVLTVTGTGTGTINVVESATTAGKFTVSDANPADGGTFTGVNSVRLNLTGGNTVNVDLSKNALADDLFVKLGNGPNSLTVADGTIAGAVNVQGGTATDVVTLGSTGTTLKVGENVDVALGQPANDSLTVKSGVTLSGSLTADAVNLITLANGSSVAKNLVILGGGAGNTIDVEGTVSHDLDLVNPPFHGNAQGGTSLTLGATASVGHDLRFVNSLVNGHPSQLTTAAGSKVGHDLFYLASGKGDTLNLAGGVGGDATFLMGGGDNKVTVAKGATFGDEVGFHFEGGNNTLTFDGSAGPKGSKANNLSVTAGKGNNTITIQGDAVVNGDASIKLGAGKNVVTLANAATVTGTLTASAGKASTFNGHETATHMKLVITGFGTINP
jgi:hypothetical protein